MGDSSTVPQRRQCAPLEQVVLPGFAVTGALSAPPDLFAFERGGRLRQDVENGTEPTLIETA